MAYITKETVKEIREDLKTRFPRKDGWKFSVSGGNSSNLTIKIVEGPVTFEVWEYDRYSNDPEMPKGPQHARAMDNRKVVTNGGVNPYYIDDNFVDGKGKDALVTIVKDVIGKRHWDKSDIQTDYFNTAFYFNVKIGKDYDVDYINVSEFETA